MKFIEFEDSDTGEMISVKAERVDAVYKAAQPDAAIMRIAESIVKVKGTRAEVVGKLEAFALFNERKQREAAALGLNGTEQLATVPTLSGRKWILDPRCKECRSDSCPHPNDCKGRWDYPDAKTEEPGAFPTEPGLYECQWNRIWIPFEVEGAGDPDPPFGTALKIKHSSVAVGVPYYLSAGAEWRKRDVPK